MGLFVLIGPALVPLTLIELCAVNHQSSPSLPLYTASLNCAPGRCEPLPPRLYTDSILELTLRPSSRVKGPLTLRAALISDSGVEPWPVTLILSPEGTFHLRAPVRSLPQLQPGLHKLLFVIGRSDAVDELQLAQARQSPSVVVLQQSLEIAPAFLFESAPTD